MRWERVPLATLCGRCGRQLAKGEAVLVISIEQSHGITRPIRLNRCETCAGPAPPDLPLLVERSNDITPTSLHRVGALLPLGWQRQTPRTLPPVKRDDDPPPDWKARAYEREPGEDDE